MLNVALLQMMACGDDVAANLAKGEEYCRRARAMGADLALFPEMWSVGYSFPPRDDAAAHARWQAMATPADGAFVQHFRGLAKELKMAIAVTYLEAWPEAPRNSVSVIDCRGEVAFTYAKVHTCDFDQEAMLTPGDAFRVGTVETARGAVQIGCMICYDREFPESARVLMLQGAEIILVPNACTMGPTRLAQVRTRAYENMVGVAMACYPAPRDNGHSAAYDGIAFAVEDGPERDMLSVEAGEAEGIYLAPFDLEAIRDYRAREAWGNAFRKPGRYGALVDTAVMPPFVREEARR